MRIVFGMKDRGGREEALESKNPSRVRRDGFVVTSSLPHQPAESGGLP